MAWAWKRRGEWIDFGLGKVNFIHSSCFGSVVECWQHRDVFVLADPAQKHSLASLHPPGLRLGVHKDLGESTARTVTQINPRDMHGLAASCSACRAAGTFGVLAFVIQSHHNMGQSPAVLGWLNTFLPVGNEGWIPCFAVLCVWLFLYMLKCL